MYISQSNQKPMVKEIHYLSCGSLFFVRISFCFPSIYSNTIFYLSTLRLSSLTQPTTSSIPPPSCVCVCCRYAKSYKCLRMSGCVKWSSVYIILPWLCGIIKIQVQNGLTAFFVMKGQAKGHTPAKNGKQHTHKTKHI